MNKLDKQFEEMMKGITIDSPSSDFTMKVMSRIQAEAAVQKRPILAGYEPAISKKTWIMLLIIFAALMIYITVAGKDTDSANTSGFIATILNSMNQLEVNKVSSFWQKGMGIFSSIPMVAYLIITASLALLTLDGFLNLFKHEASKIRMN
jgi:hypothetical protein